MLSLGRIFQRRMTTASTHGLRPKNPLIAVIGATGTGKSQLAVEIAKKYNGEIINCDAVQMYQGLPIITNKITPAEQCGIPHHLLGCIGIEEPTWTVGTFVTRASKIIEEIRLRGKLPVLVGGTHYYIQSLLTDGSLVENEPEDEESIPELDEPTEVLLAKLKEVDPVMAARWHPNERRKIQRSLQIWMKTGRPASEVYAEQKESAGQAYGSEGINGSAAAGSRKHDPLVFWVHAENDILRARLDGRVLKMIDGGLLDEVNTLYDFRSQKDKSDEPVDVSRGIWVSIGFKEFAGYCAAVKDGSPAEVCESLKKIAIERTQAATRQYAKRQLRWIRYKLLNAMARIDAKDGVYLLDGSELPSWEVTVQEPALDITSKFLEGAALPQSRAISDVASDMLVPKGEDLSHSRHRWQQQMCKHCRVTAVTVEDWEKHIKSNRHKKVLASIKKRQDLETYRGLKEQDQSAPAAPELERDGNMDNTAV